MQGDAATAAKPNSWDGWLLGVEPKMRWRVSQQLFAGALMYACALLMLYAAAQSGVPPAWVARWLGLALGAPLLGYGLIRSGWSRRLADPSLTAPQIVVSLAIAAAAYPMAGALRALALPIMLLILVFGMYRLRALDAIRMALWGLACLSAAAAVTVHWRMPGADLAQDLGHLLMALVTFPAVAIMVARMSVMRHRLREQREQLNQALARIEELATRDLLTGLPNRRHADALLRQALQRHRRNGAPFSLALIDLDHFKRINDGHGHAVGDLVLQAFAQAGQACLRGSDLLARWGGEEFVLLLEDSDAAAAAKALERLQQAVRAASGQGELPTFSFSAGLASYRDGESPEQLLERADRALYQAKSDGRDRVFSL